MQQTKKIMLGIVVMLISALTVSAQNNHFIGGGSKGGSGTQNADGSLTYCFKISGLGNNVQFVCVTLHTDRSTTTTCDNAGTNPNNPVETKTTVNDQPSISGTFPVSKNGSAEGCLTIAAPTAGPCPNSNWTANVGVLYSNTGVTSTTGACQ